MVVIVVAIENITDIQENKRVPRDTQIGPEQLRYTVWTVKHLNQIIIGYTQTNCIWIDSLNKSLWKWPKSE